MASKTRMLIVLASVALFPAFQSTARSGSSGVIESFESDTVPPLWFFDGQGTFSGSIIENVQKSASGYRFARISALNGWSSVGRKMSVPTAHADVVSCIASAYVRPLTSGRVTVEVIDPSTWTYLALGSYTLHASSNYSWLPAPSWFSHRLDAVVRITVVGGGTTNTAYVDWVQVRCNW
jgi:hypothetical protein